MAKKTQIKVKFYIEKSGDLSTVCAAFPELIATDNPLHMTCYAHVGQHSAAHEDYFIGYCRTATKEEYGDLWEEVKQIYNDDETELVLLHRVNHWHYRQIRIEELKKYK